MLTFEILSDAVSIVKLVPSDKHEEQRRYQTRSNLSDGQV